MIMTTYEFKTLHSLVLKTVPWKNITYSIKSRIRRGIIIQDSSKIVVVQIRTRQMLFFYAEIVFLRKTSLSKPNWNYIWTKWKSRFLFLNARNKIYFGRNIRLISFMKNGKRWGIKVCAIFQSPFAFFFLDLKFRCKYDIFTFF